ncbi:MAG: serine/threonine-protein kinase [Ilumatobacteraceae bacterium]
MPSRQASKPPVLPGFTFIEPIGSGGYADVFLYEQESPNRRVAVKVLDPGAVPAGAVADYTAEANLMARVPHPYIVPVFMADVAADGRPYLVMEYYPGRNFYDRARQERISVAEALRVGVQLASAVETAHRAGMLHRDIKPANVLTSKHRWPGLTDFGIASLQGPAADTAEGLSIPWSPPEAIGEAPVDVRSDVYSLAATVYTLLAGRSPFEVRGGDNRPLALIGRIERNPVPAIGRADVPAMLERVLATAMAKDRAHRPATAAELGRQLQAVESSLNLVVTELVLAEDPSTVRHRDDDGGDDGATIVKKIVEVEAQDAFTVQRPPVAGASTAPISTIPVDGRAVLAPAASVAERRRVGLLAEPEIADTMHRPSQATAPSPEVLAPPRGVPRVLYVALAVAAVVGLVIAGVALLGGGNAPQKTRVEQQAGDAEVNENVDLSGVATVTPLKPIEITTAENGDGTFTFTWPDRGAGFMYSVSPDAATDGPAVDTPTFTGSSACVYVKVIGPDGVVSAATATTACTQAGGG